MLINKIAVLIPTYKPKDYFLRCLQSLEKQTISKEKFCVYIALNGIKSPYEKLIKKMLVSFNFKYQYFYLEQAGVSKARNYLIDKSLEEYIVFVDDDDVLSENYLNNLLEVSSKYYMGISNTLSFEISPDLPRSNFISNTFEKIEYLDKSKFKTRKYYSSPWAKMLHRDQIAKIRFNERLKKHEDSLFMAQISKNIKGIKKTSKDTIYYVYEREGSASRTKENIIDELKTQFYLYYKYFILLISPRYNKLFIVTRIVATMRNLKNIF